MCCWAITRPLPWCFFAPFLAYVSLCWMYGQDCDSFLSSNSLKLKELLDLMVNVLPSCHFSAKRHRLDCLYFLVVYVSKVCINKRYLPFQFIQDSFLGSVKSSIIRNKVYIQVSYVWCSIPKNFNLFVERHRAVAGWHHKFPDRNSSCT